MHRCMLFSLALITAAAEFCYDTPDIVASRVTKACCGFPLDASVEYLTGTTPMSGPCNMFSASNRFDRFREWLNSIGGYANPKVSFYRGFYTDPVDRRLRFSVGGLFLNPNEVLHPSEAVFTVPDEAIFHDRMIVKYLSDFPKFVHANSTKLWFSMGLAALMKHHPEVVGPWVALLPDMSYQPILWNHSDLDHLVGTYAHTMIMSSINYVEEGCDLYADFLEKLDVSKTNVAVAYAIISSRSFGLEVFPNDEPSAIPFGPDFLNHNPNTLSWISALRHEKFQDFEENMPPPHVERVDCLFFLQSYTLSESRELFNNYGPHALSTNMVLYGFTSPDMKDELVIVATSDDYFDGKRFSSSKKAVCPAHITVDMLSHTPGTCPLKLPPELSNFDEAGSFRLVNRDIIVLEPKREFRCENQIGGPMWEHVAKALRSRNVRLEGNEYILRLNVMDGAEPQLLHPSVAWMALCGLPAATPPHLVSIFIDELSTCKADRGKKYFEEYPVDPLVKNIAKLTLLKGCVDHETFVIGSLEFNMSHWLAYRNAKRSKINRTDRIELRALPPIFQSSKEFINLLQRIVASNHIVYTDGGGPIDTMTAAFMAKTLTKVDRMEEVYKYRMQTAYMMIRKCRHPLERITKSPKFRTLVSDLEF